ncbi:MAG: protein kinase [Verrucomicrobiaceae bacterium]|nr:protein kinase [Verrucomicrobiaceae bacterium]
MAVSFSSAPPPEDEHEVPWTTFGGLELFEEIGRGGMGVVYRARQTGLDRTVAVKVLLRAQFASAEERERFQREAQAAARLQHPGIVGIHEVGEDEGVPWFSMDHIAGHSLEQAVREHPMEAMLAARCVQSVATALQHAHDNGVLHRDLKPSNILLDADEAPRITDFGIARVLNNSTTTNRRAAELTRTGQSLGSPGYAAPEQALAGKADARTDVYGLGALLYHLLTGRPPFQGPTLDAILVQLRENDPLSPRRLNPSVPRDLETICLKCLSKQPEGRYATADAVADDLLRFIEGRPIVARPLGFIGKAWRWTRRYPALAAMIVFSALLIVAMIVGSLAFARHKQQLEHRTSLISEARSLRQRRIAGSRTEALAALHRAWAIAPSAEIRNEIIACLALPELGTRTRIAKATAPDLTRSADGKRVAVIEGNTVIVRDVMSGQEVARLPNQKPGSLMKLDDHGERIAIAAPKSKDLRLVNLADGKVIATCSHEDALGSVDWSSELIATGCDDYFIYIWDAKGKRHRRLSGHEAYPIRVSFRPRSQELMSISRDVHVRLWHVARGQELVRHDLPHEPYTRVWWNETGTQFFGATEDGGTDVYPVTSSPILQVLAPPEEEPHTENFGSAALSADGSIAAVIDEASMRLWDLASARLVTELTGHPNSWRSAHFSPDHLWTCGWDEQLTSRALSRDAQGRLTIGPATPRHPDYGCILRMVSADGQALVLSNNSTGKFIVLWPQTGRTLQVREPGNLATQLSHDHTWLLTSSYLKTGSRIWSLSDGKLLRTLCERDTIIQAIISPDGQRLLVNTGKHGYAFRTRDWTEEKLPAGDLPLESMAFSPDARYLATLGDDHIRLRDPITLEDELRLTLPAHVGWLGQGHLVFDADGSTLIVHTALGTVARWNLTALHHELTEAGIQ